MAKFIKVTDDEMINVNRIVHSFNGWIRKL